MILGQDFKFREDFKTDTTPFELMVDPYKGIVYRYVKLDLTAFSESDPRIKFDFLFLELNGFREKPLRKDVKFIQLLGLILNSIIIDTMEINGVLTDEETVEV